MIQPDSNDMVMFRYNVMRYSARQRNVVWKDDAPTREAAACLLDLLDGRAERIIDHCLVILLKRREPIEARFPKESVHIEQAKMVRLQLPGWRC